MSRAAAAILWSRETIVQVLCRTALFGGLTASQTDTLSEHVIPLQYAPGQVVFLMDEDPQGVYVLADGAVRSIRQTPNGREQVLSVEYPCSTIGEVPVLDHGRHFSTAIAEARTNLLFIRKSDMQRLCTEYPDLFRRSIEVLANRLRAYAEVIHTLSLREVDRRVAWLVLNEARRRGVPIDSGIALELTTTHHDIACRVGCAREMVTRAFSHLHKSGLLNVRGRLITIPDETQLADYVSMHAESAGKAAAATRRRSIDTQEA
jgi:CRP/FNR family transcriptional regulator